MLNLLLCFIGNFLKKMKYQVGDIYITSNPNMNTVEAVANRFGGVWEKIENRFLLGAGSKTLGAIGGEEVHTLSGAEIPSHTHGFSATTSSNGEHGHGLKAVYRYDISGNGYALVENNTTISGAKPTSTGTSGTHNHSVSGTTGATGSSKAHNNMPPYEVVYMYRKIA